MKGVLTLQARARKSTSFPGFSLFLENRHTIAAFDCDGSLVVRGRIKNVYQVPIVQTLDSTIQQKNHISSLAASFSLTYMTSG